MSLDLLLAGAAGGVVGATTVLAARAVSAAVTKLTRATKSRSDARTRDNTEPPSFAPNVVSQMEWHATGSTTSAVITPTEPDAEATAHARLRASQLAEFADQLAGDDLALRERLRRFEGGLR